MLVEQALHELEVAAALQRRVEELGFDELVEPEQRRRAPQLVAHQAVRGLRALPVESRLEHDVERIERRILLQIGAEQVEPFSYDPLTDLYKFVWKTKRAWAGWCGTLSVPLADGQTYKLEVAFKA